MIEQALIYLFSTAMALMWLSVTSVRTSQTYHRRTTRSRGSINRTLALKVTEEIIEYYFRNCNIDPPQHTNYSLSTERVDVEYILYYYYINYINYYYYILYNRVQ